MRYKWFKRRKNDAIYLLALSVFAIARITPRKLGVRLFGWMGQALFLLPLRERRRTLDNLRFIYGEQWPEKKIRRTGRNVFRHLAQNMYDALYFSQCTREKMLANVTYDELEGVKQAFDKGRGLIMITAHLGCFEMLLHFFAHMGFSGFAIGSKLYDERLDRLVAELRSGENITYMHRSGSGRNVLRQLRRGKAFGVLLDQDTKLKGGVFAHFLGHLAYTPSAPLRLALQFDIPVAVVIATRGENDCHHISITGPLKLQKSGETGKDILLAVEQVNKIISAAINKTPEQWVWMHRRWRHQPDQPAYAKVPSIKDI